MYNNNNRVFGGAMTKAQKAHMAATEWEPLWWWFHHKPTNNNNRYQHYYYS
jgi:hypothetical protein